MRIRNSRNFNWFGQEVVFFCGILLSIPNPSNPTMPLMDDLRINNSLEIYILPSKFNGSAFKQIMVGRHTFLLQRYFFRGKAGNNIFQRIKWNKINIKLVNLRNKHKLERWRFTHHHQHLSIITCFPPHPSIHPSQGTQKAEKKECHGSQSHEWS